MSVIFNHSSRASKVDLHKTKEKEIFIGGENHLMNCKVHYFLFLVMHSLSKLIKNG